VTKVGTIMAVLSLVFGALAVRDIRVGDAGFVVATLRKWEHPLPFWGLVAAEIVAALLCAGGAAFAFSTPVSCDDNGVCSLLTQRAPPSQPLDIPCPKEGCRVIDTSPRPLPEAHP
jgi:hypothetical protein